MQTRILTHIDDPNACRGFTLIEVLIALVIFAVGILAIASMQIKSISLNSAARMQTEATTAAVDRMERLLSLPYEHPDLVETELPQQDQAGAYTVFWLVTDESPISWCKTIAVWVTANNPHARAVRINFIRGPEW
jgi:prepilin-type N-terminal cleavage/methylation domain-containing protein